MYSKREEQQDQRIERYTATDSNGPTGFQGDQRIWINVGNTSGRQAPAPSSGVWRQVAGVASFPPRTEPALLPRNQARVVTAHQSVNGVATRVDRTPYVGVQQRQLKTSETPAATSGGITTVQATPREISPGRRLMQETRREVPLHEALAAGMVSADSGLREADAAASVAATSDPEVEMELVLDESSGMTRVASTDAFGMNEKVFRDTIANDLASAVGGDASKIQVLAVGPGSPPNAQGNVGGVGDVGHILVNVLLRLGVCRTASPLSIAEDLERQVPRTGSQRTLRTGTSDQWTTTATARARIWPDCVVHRPNVLGRRRPFPGPRPLRYRMQTGCT